MSRRLKNGAPTIDLSATLEGSKSELVDGILADAKAEAENLVAEAEKYAAERIAASRDQEARILREAEAKAKDQAQKIRKMNESAANVEKRRILLRIREELTEKVLADAETGFERFADGGEYAGTLKSWIVEAAIGLNEDRAVVYSSAKDAVLIDDALLRGAEEEFRALTGRTLGLSKTGERKARQADGAENADFRESLRGIVLESVSGRTAFSNQLPTRFLRFRTEIRKLIYEALFAAEDKDK